MRLQRLTAVSPFVAVPILKDARDNGGTIGSWSGTGYTLVTIGSRHTNDWIGGEEQLADVSDAYEDLKKGVARFAMGWW